MDAGATPWVDISQDEHIGAGASVAAFAGGAGVLGLLLLVAAVLWARNRIRARMADRSHDPAAALAPGEAVVSGQVELSADAAHAVRVEIEQRGEETESSGAWNHTWTEIDRRVKVAPFYVRHASGARVRVEPGAEVRLLDALDATVQSQRDERTQVAELTAGEPVMVHGRLGWGPDPEARTDDYRGGPANGLVLRPVGAAPMMISTEGLGERFRRHARAARWALVAASAAALLFAALTSTYQISLFSGRVVPVSLVQRSYYAMEDDEGSWDGEYRIAFGGDGVTDTQEVTVGAGDFFRLRKGMTLKYRAVAVGSGHLGGRATMHVVVAGFSIFVVGVGCFAWLTILRASRKWYERARVVDSGSGRLDASSRIA